MKTNFYRSCAVGLLMLAGAAMCYGQADNSRVSLMTKAVELVDVKSGAEKCRGQKGVTITLRVVSDSPVDIMSYKRTGQLWGPSLFSGKQKGDQITDFACFEKAPFKIYSRAAGSSEPFPDPK